MKTGLITLTAILALPLAAYAQGTPEVRVSDGKVSISAMSIPVGRLLDLLDKAVGMKSEVKPELANQLISVRFTNLELKDAVRKIFEGQPLSYFLIEGKGVRVVDRFIGGGTTSIASSPTSPPFPDSQPIITNQPINIGNNPPVQAPAAQPAQPNNPFGQPPAPANTATPGAAFQPGQLPPPLGATNPLITPASNNNNTVAPATGFPLSTPAPAQPAGPGALPGATPGQIGR